MHFTSYRNKLTSQGKYACVADEVEISFTKISL